jgi:hypothetical protein
MFRASRAQVGSDQFLGRFDLPRLFSNSGVTSRGTDKFAARNARPSSVRLDPDPIIDRRLNPLLAAEVAFRGLNGDVPQKELYLFQLSSSSVAQASTGPTKVVGSQFLQSDPLRRILNDVPNSLLGHAFTLSPSHLGDPTKDLSSVDPRCIQPDAQFFHNPAGHRNRSDVSGLAFQVDDGPVFLSLFQMFESKGDSFVSTQTTGEQECEKRTIAFAFQVLPVGSLPECKALLGIEPIPESDA